MKKNLKCLTCGSKTISLACKSKSRFSDRWFLLVKCKRCGLVFRENCEDAKQMIDSYAKDLNSPGYYQSIFLDRYRYGLFFIDRYLKNEQMETFVDIGCGTGAMLQSARDRGAKRLIGTEINQASLGECSRAGIADALYNADLCDESLPKELKNCQADVVFCNQTLEHLHKPNEAIKNISRILKKGGILLISVPNLAHYSFFLPLLTGRDNRGVFDVPAHFATYNLRSIKSFLNRQGFEVVKAEPSRSYKGLLTLECLHFLNNFSFLIPTITIVVRK